MEHSSSLKGVKLRMKKRSRARNHLVGIKSQEVLKNEIHINNTKVGATCIIIINSRTSQGTKTFHGKTKLKAKEGYKQAAFIFCQQTRNEPGSVRRKDQLWFQKPFKWQGFKSNNRLIQTPIE